MKIDLFGGKIYQANYLDAKEECREFFLKI
jgi:hypothetical protein